MVAKPKWIRLGIAALLGAAALAGLAVAGSFGGVAGRRGAVDRRPALARATASAVAGSTARFAFLARQTSTNCGLGPAALERMPGRMRLQGSCCSAMKLAAYRSQVHRLRVYGRLPEIPADPYDVSVALAKRLLGCDRMITLDPAQARVYQQAIRMTREKGPCCCDCWRWNAFRGVSKYLIARRGWRSGSVAAIIDLMEDCGGPVD